jgi:hypothetical protein
MNTIFYSKRHELKRNYYVIPFSCSDLMNVNTEVSYRDRTETEQKVIQSVMDRITKALYNQGYILQSVNFRNMSVSCMSVSCIVDEYQVNLSTKVSQR